MSHINGMTELIFILISSSVSARMALVETEGYVFCECVCEHAKCGCTVCAGVEQGASICREHCDNVTTATFDLMASHASDAISCSKSSKLHKISMAISTSSASSLSDIIKPSRIAWTLAQKRQLLLV